MISKECKITVSGNTASIDSEIYLYKNDMNIKYLFNIVNGDYAYTKDSNLDNIINANKASYAQIKFKKEDIEIDFDVQETSNGKVILLIKKELIDEDTELGDYTIQIRLFDESKTSVITLPPVNNCIHIMRPIFEKVDGSTNVVDEAAVDEAIVTYSEPMEAIASDGTFAKKTWVAKEKITTAELNRMEEGIAYNNSQYKDIVNLSLVKHADGKVYIKKQDGTLLGNGIEIGGSDVDLSKITMSMSGQTLKLLNDGEQVATVEIPTAVVTDEQLTSIIQSKIDDGTLSALSIEDGSIGIEKNNWIRFLYYNEVDVNSATDGNWYSDATDLTNTYNNNKISNYIKVNPGDLVNLKNYSKVHFYDINKKYTNGNAFSNKSTWTVPEGIYYLRVQFTNNQVQVYLGDKAHDYDSYHNLYDIQIADNQFIESIYKNIELGIKKSTINLNDNLSDEYIDIDKLKVLKNFRWAIIKPANITHYKQGDYYVHESGIEEVVPGETLYGGSYTINCYDINKNSLNKALTYDGGKYIVPNDTYYLKVQITNDTTPEDFKFILHRHKYNMNALHSKYISYDYSFPVLRDSSLLVYMQNYLGINKLSEKKFISVGDSFSAPNKWQKVVMELLQMNGITTALSGARFSSGEVKNAYEQLKQYDAESYNADYILITMGTNDSANNVTIGSFVESNNIADFDLTTYYGGIQAVLNYACNTWKDAVVAIGFTPACGISYNEAYIEPLKKCARLYGAYYIDTLSMGYSAYVTNQADHIYGGHPTELGQQKIGRRMAKIIESL